MRSFWFGAGSSDVLRVLSREWWRTITALTLHSDSNHALSNIAAGTIVVTMVMRRTGVGLGAALVVLAGALGNLVNARGYGTHHNSIGFSTAVFGAIGLLGSLTYVSAVREKSAARRRRPAWTAIAGTLALLAMLGASERSDILAHLFRSPGSDSDSRWACSSCGHVPSSARRSVGSRTAALVIGAWAAALAPA